MPIDNPSELFYLVTKTDKVKGCITRNLAHSDKKNIHRAVGIFILNEKNQILMQKRSKKKDMDGGKWSYSVAGHVTFGQTYRQAAVKEVKEELGIKASVKLITKSLIEMEKETEYTTFFEVKILSNVHIVINKDEISQIAWIPINKLKKFIKKHDVVEWTLLALKACKYI